MLFNLARLWEDVDIQGEEEDDDADGSQKVSYTKKTYYVCDNGKKLWQPKISFPHRAIKTQAKGISILLRVQRGRYTLDKNEHDLYL